MEAPRMGNAHLCNQALFGASLCSSHSREVMNQWFSPGVQQNFLATPGALQTNVLSGPSKKVTHRCSKRFLGRSEGGWGEAVCECPGRAQAKYTPRGRLELVGGAARLPTPRRELLFLAEADMLWTSAVLPLVSFGTPGIWDATHWGPPHENPDVAGIG